MSDLISRSALIEILSKYKFGAIESDSVREYIKETVLDFVREQPIAYDVEKVVEELEEERFKFRQMKLEAVHKGMAIHSDIFLGKQYSYENAIDIVRKGGVE